MRLGSVCSGIGGLDLAVERHYGAAPVWQVDGEGPRLELDECYHVFGRLRRREPALQYAAARVEVWEAAIAAVRAEAERR